MENLTCNYCDKLFTTLSNLTTHKKTAKYCLKIQGLDSTVAVLLVCEFCNKESTQKANHERHLKVCELRKMSDHDKEIQTIKKALDLELKKSADLGSRLQNSVDEIARLKEDLAFERGQNKGYARRRRSFGYDYNKKEKRQD